MSITSIDTHFELSVVKLKDKDHMYLHSVQIKKMGELPFNNQLSRTATQSGAGTSGDSPSPSGSNTTVAQNQLQPANGSMKAPDSDVPRIFSIFKRLMEVKGENEKNKGKTRYQLNQFGFDEYTEKEKGWWKDNPNIILCNSKQDIIDFYKNHVHKKPYTRLYIGKIGEELSEKIYRDTGVETKGLNVAITSEYEDSHNDIQKEKLRGQIPITPELLSDLPEIISGYDKVENATKSYDRKPALKFEKDINGKRVAIEYVRSKKGLLELQTMYAWEKKKSKGVSPTLTMPAKQTDPYRTSETYSGLAPADSSINSDKEKVKVKNERFQLEDVDEGTDSRIEQLMTENEELKKRNAYLQKQMQLTPKTEISQEDIKKTAA